MMPFIPDANMNTNYPDDKNHRGVKPIRTNANIDSPDHIGPEKDDEILFIYSRRFWFHFLMFCVGCLGIWLISPQFEKEFLSSKNFYDAYLGIFSNLRASIGFVVLLSVLMVSKIYEYRYKRSVREDKKSTKR